MKRILITGQNSYVGNAVEAWLQNDPETYTVDKISLRDAAWRNNSFKDYDTVLHVAGIAHVSKDPEMEAKYYQINRDLTIETAKKAKADGAKQFIFMSSIIVYGGAPGDDGMIDHHTIPKPSDFYGESKLQAETGIQPLEDDTLRVTIIRPPMIYGKGSKGNYPKLAKAAQKLPIFPYYENRRSMLHIDNLAEFIRLMIENEESGLFFPQNQAYVNTSEMVRIISEVHGKRIKLVRWFNLPLHVMRNRVGLINKVFGNLVYDQDLSRYHTDYQIRDLGDSIVATEK